MTARRYEGYLHQIAGPKSLATLEKATGESLRNIAFLRSRKAKIDGVAVEVARIGMSGTLAYEVRGPLEEGARVYDAIYRAGRTFGIQRLGWRTYFVNHVEGGFPQAGWTFFTAAIEDESFRKYAGRTLRVTGSVDPANMRARYRTPVEVGWQRAARFDHDFIGREALEREMASPRRTIATLRWNAEDVVDIYASLLRMGASPAYKVPPPAKSDSVDRVPHGYSPGNSRWSPAAPGELAGSSTWGKVIERIGRKAASETPKRS